MLDAEVDCMTHKHKLQKIRRLESFECRGSILFEDIKDCQAKSTNSRFKYSCNTCKNNVEYCAFCLTRTEIKLS